MNISNSVPKRQLFEYKAHEFSPEQRQFLAAAGWSTIAVGDLVELAIAVEPERPQEIERVTYLTRELLRRGLFAERRRAYAFAENYVALVRAGTDFRMMVWDWE